MMKIIIIYMILRKRNDIFKWCLNKSKIEICLVLDVVV